MLIFFCLQRQCVTFYEGIVPIVIFKYLAQNLFYYKYLILHFAKEA